MNGIAFGYESIEWHGHEPAPIFVTKKVVTWDSLDTLTQQEKESIILETLLKTIQSRKRQYKTCQFCGEKLLQNTDLIPKHVTDVQPNILGLFISVVDRRK